MNMKTCENNNKSVSVERSKNLKLQSVFSFVYKILSIFVSFALVPVILGSLGKERYGIWVTLFSVTSWIAFADLGFGVGLKNKLAEAIGKNNISDARKFVTSAYYCVTFIVIILLLIFFVVIPFLNWQAVFNSRLIPEFELSTTVIIVIATVLLGFIIQLVNYILAAFQKNSISLLLPIFANLFFIGEILIGKIYGIENIVFVAVCFCLSQIFTGILFTLAVFRKYSFLIPTYSFFNFLKVKEMLSLSLLFFITKITSVIIFSTDNIIIAQLFGSAEVVPYSITMKVYMSIIMVINLVTMPLWTAYTDAYAKGDLNWIKKKIIQHHIFNFGIIVFVILITYFLDDLIKIWIGKDIEVPLRLKVYAAAFVILSSWYHIYGLVIYAISKIRLNSFITVLGALINIPASIYFAKYLNLGIAGVLLGTVLSISLNFLVGPFQVYYFIFRKNKVNKKYERFLG